MFDLGSGDGRIVIMAAQKFRANAVGVEFDDALFKQSMEKIKSLGLSSIASIIHCDLLKQDYSSADLLTWHACFPCRTIKSRRFWISSSKRARAIVAHDFEFSAWTPEKSRTST